MKITDLAITSLETITVFDTNGDYLFTLDELQNATLNQGQEKVDITGKQGRKITSLKRNKTVTVSGTNGLVSTGLLEMQTGGEFVEGEGLVLWPDEISVSGSASSTTLNTTYIPVGSEGAEIISLYVKNENGTLGKEYVQGKMNEEGKALAEDGFTFAYTTGEGNVVKNGVITLGAAVEAGTEFVAYYNRKIAKALTLENISDSYSKKGKVYIDAMAEDKCANVYHVQYFIPKADFNGEFEQTLGDDQTVHAFEIEALAGGCDGVNGFFTLTIIGEGATDASMTKTA